MRSLIFGIFFLMTACDSHTRNLALGTLEQDRITHSATLSEVVVALPQAEGSKVEKGMLLVQLDETLQKAQVRKSQAQVAQAQAHLERLSNGAREEEVAAAKAEVAGAKASLIESQSNYERSVQLRASNSISQAALDSALAARDRSRAAMARAEAALRLLMNGTRQEELREAQAALDAMRATLESEKRKLADLSVTATRDGILDSLPWHLGERVNAGSLLAVVLAGKAPFASVYVPEPYRVKLHVGDTLVVRVDGLAERVTGRLRWIASEPAFTPYYALNQDERARLVYLAEVQLPETEAHLPIGVPVQVELP